MEAFGSVFHSAVPMLAGIVLLMLVVMLPARVLQKRHGYPAWILVFGLIPYLGPIALIWAFATSTPRSEMEAST